MKVLVSRDIVGVQVWKTDADLELRDPYSNNKTFKSKTLQWGTSNYWFDFRARHYSYSVCEKMFPDLINKIQLNAYKEMELTII
jgi:hypothetical protein